MDIRTNAMENEKQSMWQEDINYDGILWPLPYRIDAIHRAKSRANTTDNLSTLYEKTFAPEHLRLPAIPLSIPFSRDVDDDADARTAFSYRPDLPLSVVTVTRNDDHVEKMSERTQAFIDCLYYLADTFKRKLELIIVEWNPPAEKPELDRAFRFPNRHQYVSTQIVKIPGGLHRQYDIAEQLPLYQMIGKNVGIRRARGEFVLATNIDVLFSEELFDYISGPELQKKRIYRGNRWDVDRRILDIDDPQTRLASARNLTFQINYPHATVERDATPPPEDPMVDYGGFRQLPSLHTMACGDFQLMHRNDWADMRGYSEFDTFSFHLDSLFAITCFHAGIEEINLGNRYPHYHIDHTLGTSVKGDSYLIDNKKVMKHLSMAGLINLSRNMEIQRDHFIYNKSNWGMAGIDLPIINVTIAEWEPSGYQPKAPLSDTGKGCIDAFDIEQINIDGRQTQQQHALLQTIAAATADHLKTYCRFKKLFIWGAGHKARVFRRLLVDCGIQVDGFIDGTDSANAAANYGIKIISSDDLAGEGNCFILICSMYAEKIRQQLDRMNFSEGIDYLVGF